MKYFLTIAASDSSGGAGIQQDFRVAEKLGYHALSVITSITAQNFSQVIDVKNLDKEIVKKQLDAIYSNFNIQVCKIGVLTTKDHILHVSNFLRQNNIPIKVVDPVFVASSGFVFLDFSLINTFKEKILPFCNFLTPNKTELELISGKKIKDFTDAIDTALELHKQYSCNIYIKGGHFNYSEGIIKEALIFQNNVYFIRKKKLTFQYTHGTGCAFSSAFACYLGNDLFAIEAAKKATVFVSKLFKLLNDKIKMG